MTNTELLAKMKQIREEVKELQKQVKVKSDEGDALMAMFLKVEPGDNLDLISVIDMVYNKIHD